MTTSFLNKSGYNTYGGKSIIENNMSIHQQLTQSCVPSTGTCNTASKFQIDFSESDNYKINEIYLDITCTNGNATPVGFTLYNPFLIFQTFKLKINGVEVSNNSDMEQVFCNVAHNMEQYLHSDEELKAGIDLFMPGANGHGGAVNAGSSAVTYFSFPLLHFFYPSLIGINAKLLTSLFFEWTFANTLGAATLNGRWCLSSTTANIWNTTDLAFSNMQYRLSLERFQNPNLLQVPKNAILPIHKYETKAYSLTWTAATDYNKINISSDFTLHNKIQGMYIYIYGSALNTAYNTATCGTVVSSMGFSVKYKSQSLIDFSNSTTHPIQKRNYLNNSYKKKFDKLMSDNFYGISTNTSQKYFVPLLYIDFSQLKIAEPHTEENITHFDNSINDWEVIVYNTAGTNFGALTMFAMLEYIDIYKLNGRQVLKA
jgi:hypothetical protein